MAEGRGMKKAFFLMLLAVLMLWGCGAKDAAVDTRIQVTLMAGDGYAAEKSGVWVEPGDDAVFTLAMEDGRALDTVDYDGLYDHRIVDGKVLLTLKNVQFPARVHVQTTTRYGTLTYEPNGASGAAITKTYSLRYHSRPNTENGRDLFHRDGYTLVGWNTEADGSGIRVGLGSRVTVQSDLTLYAQWMPWSAAEDFQYTVTGFGSVTIERYLGNDETVVIPERIEGRPVTAVAPKAFAEKDLRHVVLPNTMKQVAPDAFLNTTLETVTLFDNIETISDDSFPGCGSLRTLYINAYEPPCGYEFRKESVYADKVDNLILAQGKRKLVFYAGCSVWYNLDGKAVDEAFDGAYEIINMGLNGVCVSSVQLQIMAPYLEQGDIFLHTLELSSYYQMLCNVRLSEQDEKLWCGLEYNYDLFSLVDLRTVSGAFDSFAQYLDKKTAQTSYGDHYTDGEGKEYLDTYGCIPFLRTETKEILSDQVYLNTDCLTPEGLTRLEQFYSEFQNSGVKVYVSYACVNLDEVPEGQRGNAAMVDTAVKEAFGSMEGVAVISDLPDFLYKRQDFYDTNYHLLTEKAVQNTALWIRDLQKQMAADGLWEGAE